MLKRATLAACVSLALVARAQDDDALDALRRPERLTVAINDQFLGQLAPDGQTLYFVSNQDTRKEIYAQNIEDGRATRVFDEAADVTWPRLSPDGKSLLYISFSEQAVGRLCVRSLPKGEQRRCLGDAPAALQAEWIDNKRIALVVRTSIDGDLRVAEVKVGKKLEARTLSEHNWTNPTSSPDGRWLVYVPVDRMATQVGPGFAARTAGRLEAVRLDQPSTPVAVPIDLPGMTGQPAFSLDGRWLYFVQFFSDSNHDGLLDASDHGVLFRIPFELEGKATKAEPTQLTDSSWNCQYPAPAAEKLITTCSRGRDLDVYELPLDGAVPGDWSKDRLRVELSLGGRREEQLLLYRHALAHADEPLWKRLVIMRLVMSHLELEEFAAAEFYARKTAELPLEQTRGIERPLLALVEQRRARSERERGQMLDAFADQARARKERVRDGEQDSQAARVLNRIVGSEIAGSLGDAAGARRELDDAELEGDLPRTVLEAYYWRADALYRALDDRDALVALGRRFATRNIAEDVQLDYARAMTRALTRGLPIPQALEAVARERKTADGELAFALDLVREVLSIRPGKPEPGVRERMIALYEAQTRPERKRAIVLDAVQRAADIGADWAIECLSERYLKDVPPGTQERRRAERLYRRAIMGRAYRQLSKGRVAEARGDFDQVYRETEALEALAESISLRLQQGMTPASIEAELVPRDGVQSPVARFAHAYLLARQLPKLRGEAHAQAVAEANRALRDAWTELKGKAPARALLGSIMHEKFLRENDFAAAETANAHYIVALELVQNDPRAQAMLQGALGMLHTRVGNYRIALDYLEQRERFPFGDDLPSFSIRLAAARARLHVGQDEGSAKAADEALAMVERTPGLARYRVLALDRAALANLAARRFERALALYDAELKLLAPDRHAEARRNRFVVRLAHAAAAAGANAPERTLQDLDAIEPELEDGALVEALAPPHVSEDLAARSYGTIVAGLRANANLALGRLEPAGKALERRRELYAARLKASEREEDARALTLVEMRLAANALARKDPASAAKFVELALQNADALAARIAAPADGDQMQVLCFAAELQALHGSPLNLAQRLEDGQRRMVAQHDPAYRNYQRWFEIYQTLLQGSGQGPGVAQGAVLGAGQREQQRAGP